jgi:uncharacterized repeat protein (TIGR01451 family)
MGTKPFTMIRCLAGLRHRALPAFVAIALLMTGAIAIALSSSSPGGGVDDTAVFELEGNALDDVSITFNGTQVATPGDDWENVFKKNGKATATSFVTDTVNSTGDNSFLGTSSKDTQDITAWSWQAHKSQAKDDIAHAFAAAYTAPNQHTFIYAGMDRFDNSGDSTAGFWFVQDSSFDLCTGVGIGSRGANPGCKSAGSFAGKHTNGDLLIVSDFSTGGAASTIDVFVWDGTTPLKLDAARSPAPCDPVHGTNTLCGLANSADGVSTGTWSFTDKSNKTTYLHGEFLEIGIDLNDPNIFPNGAPCFSTFMAETRSSTSTSASLSDLTTPVAFPLCSFTADKTCDNNGKGTVNTTTNKIDYSWTISVKNTGSSTLYDVTVSDILPGDSNATDIAITSSLASGATATKQVTYSASGSGAASATNTLKGGSAATTSGGIKNVSAIPANNAKDFPAPTCTADVSGVIGIVKACDTTKGGAILTTTGCASVNDVCVEVFFTATVSNSGNETLTSITLADTPSASFDNGAYSTTLKNTANVSNGVIDSLKAGDSVVVTGHYFPSSIDSSGVPGRFLFKDTVEVKSATGSLGKDPGPAPGSANCPDPNDLACSPVSCPICPANTCIP